MGLVICSRLYSLYVIGLEFNLWFMHSFSMSVLRIEPRSWGMPSKPLLLSYISSLQTHFESFHGARLTYWQIAYKSNRVQVCDHEQYFRWFIKGLWRNLIQESLQSLISQTGVNDQLNDWPDHFYGCFSSCSKLPVQLMLKWLSHQLHSPNKHAPCSWQCYRHWINSRQKSFSFTSFCSSRCSGNKWTKRIILKKHVVH